MDSLQSREITPDMYDGGDNSHSPVPKPVLDGSGEQTPDAPAMEDGYQGRASENGTKHALKANGLSNSTMAAKKPEVPVKRKRSHDESFQTSAISGLMDELSGLKAEPETKRIKSEPASTRQAEPLHKLDVLLWQRIFAFVPPVPLARLLRVCRPFKILLDAPVQAKASQRSIGSTVIGPGDSDRIWESSHKFFARGLPAPFQDQRELDMWRLIKGHQCQFCGQARPLSTDSGSASTFQAGPGRGSVRVVWPFKVRLCGDCLRSNTRTDDELTLSGSFPSFLKDALPAVYLGESNDFVSEAKYETFPPPPGFRFVKVYYRPQVEAIKRRYDHMKEFYPTQAAEWVQNLDQERTQIQKDVDRWEIWEQKGALAKLNSRSGPGKVQKPRLDGPQNGQPFLTAIQQVPQQQLAMHSQMLSPVGQSFNQSPWGTYQPAGPMMQYPMLGSLASATGIPPKPPRNYLEIQAARAARRAEIERRCMLLAPPMPSKLLEHMESFRAALQISTMLDDAQWDFLKVRLESERSGAEEKLAQQPPSPPEPQPVAKPESLPEQPKQSHFHVPGPHNGNGPNFTAQIMPVHVQHTESHTLEHDDPKAEIHIDEIELDPNSSNLQKRLAHFADQVTLGKWNGGRSLSKDSCPQFAAEVLLQVRKNYYEEAFGGQHSFDASLPRYLTLENMKWVFDNRIKPLTEQFQKDIFLCNGCENNTKGYGFEAVIQHFAAKHTTSLSMGSVVVHWKAEWPEKPPFHPNPMLVMALAIASSTSQIPPSQVGNHSFDTGSANITYPGPPPSQPHTEYHPGQAPASYTHPPFHQSGYPGQSDHAPQPLAGPPAPFHLPGTSAHPPVYPQHSSNYHSNDAYGNGVNLSPYPPTPVGPGMPYTVPPPPDANAQSGETYRKHLAELAKFARELWFATAGVKGLPGTVRTQIIVHHACERFVGVFQLQPGVAMFLDGLNHESAMRPLRSLNGFACKACASGQGGAVPPSERKQCTLPHLLGHFRTAHAEITGLDWRRDMVQLPMLSTITDLVNVPGMDDSKFALLAAAIPGAFPTPLPTLAALQRKTVSASVGTASRTNHGVPSSAYQRDVSSSPVKAMGYSGIIPPPSSGNRASGSPGDDEYDPRRPSYVGHLVPNKFSNKASQQYRQEGFGQPANGSTAWREPEIKREPADADRFLDDLGPQLPSSGAGTSRVEYITTSGPQADRYTSYSHGQENHVARHENGQYTIASDRYHPEAERLAPDYHDSAADRYVTRYYEPTSRVEYAPVNQEPAVAYYIREPDGRLVPASDPNPPRIVYETRSVGRDYGYEHGPRGEDYAQRAPATAAYREDTGAYSYAHAPRGSEHETQRVVYVDRWAEPDSHTMYDPNQSREGYRRDQVYIGEDGYRR